MQDEENSELKIRNECINSLLSSINELTSIVKDLQTVVQEQGTILDRIDYNIDIAMDNTQKAYGHINEANKLQKQSCFRNTVLIIMFIIFFEFILLINKYL
jgi:syntaxin 16